MIKNPKLGQEVFFVNEEGVVFKGKLSQVYCSSINGAVGIDNFFYIDKSFVFSTKGKAQEYNKLTQDLEFLNEQIFKLSKQREKLATKLAKLLGGEKQRT